MTFLSKYTKYYAYISFFVLILLLIPLMVLGFYNHPLGDDYYYGQYAAKAIRESGNIISAIPEAFKGVINEYKEWQGTYFAIFLMYLPPQLFGEFFYKIYPSVLLLFFAASIFYLLHPIVYQGNKDSEYAWIGLSSTFMIVATQQVPLCGETFYWYNGSMYYTGFLSLTFFFFGMLLRYLQNKKFTAQIPLIIVAFLIAGGNYASLLPAILAVVIILIDQIIKKDKDTIKVISIILLVMLVGLLISILAPGNAVRGATTVGTTPVKAVIKSIRQAFHYSLYWNGFVSFIALMLLGPVFLKLCVLKEHIKLSLLKMIVIFLVFASSETATFYAQNNGGPARLFDICFYMMLIALSSMWFINLKYAYDHMCLKTKKREKEKFFPSLLIVSEIFLVCFFFILWAIRPLTESTKVPNSATALKTILNGDAKYYASQYDERMDAVKSNPGGDLIFASYDVPEDLIYFLFLGDLSGDEEADSNKAFSEFYNINSVKISD